MVTITPSERFTPYSPVVPTTVFAVGFPILDNADVVLMHNSAVVSGTIVSGTYVDGVCTDAVITAPVGLVGNVQVVGTRVPQRTSQYAAGKPLPIGDHNYALNRVEMEIQEAGRENNRSLKLPVGDKPKDFPIKAERAGKYLSFDAAGNPVAVTEVHEVAKVAAIATEIVTVAGISGEVVAVADNKTNIDIVASIHQAVSAVGTVADDIPIVVEMRPEIQAVIADKANISTVAGNIGNVNKVAAVDASVSKVAAIDTDVSKVAAIDADVSRVSAISLDVQTVAGDRVNINAVAANKTNIDNVAGNKANIDAVAGNKPNIDAVVGNADNINNVAVNKSNIDIVAANETRINSVAANEARINAVAGNEANINTVAAHAADVDLVSANMARVVIVADNIGKVAAVAVIAAEVVAVADIKAAVQAVAVIGEDVQTVSRNIASVVNVAGNKTNIDIVALNIADIQNASQNMAAIKAAPDAATRSETAAGKSKDYRDEALAVFANMKGGAVGYALVKRSAADYDYEWLEITGLGDMTKAIFDPTGVNGDAFSMGNMVETATAKIMTNTERTRLASMATGATANTGTVTSVAVAVPAGLDATGAITTSGTITISYASGYQAYTTAEANKLAGINLGLYQTLAVKGLANGYAALDAAGKVPTTQLPDTVLGAVRYIGVWDAATNSPSIPAASAANKGWYYMVSVTGTANIDGNGEWVVGDWIVSNGTRWDRVKNVDAVIDVAGLRGSITAAALKIALSLQNVANKSEAQMVANGAIADALGSKLPADGRAADSYLLDGQTAAQLPISSATQVELNEKAGFYAGSDANITGYPVGTVLAAFGAAARNSTVLVKLGGDNGAVDIGSGGVQLSGQWCARGRLNISGGNYSIVQRIS